MIDILVITGIGFIILIAIFLILIFNGLVVLSNQIKNSWAQIDVQLKRRADLIPNLVETVKGYAKHEKSVFTEVTAARAATTKASNVKSKAEASNMLTSALKTLFAVSENYPKLQANQNFLHLQEELSGIEGKIAYARQFYNDAILKFNTKIQVFPNNLVAGLFGFGKEQEYFQIEPEDKIVPKIKF